MEGKGRRRVSGLCVVDDAMMLEEDFRVSVKLIILVVVVLPSDEVSAFIDHVGESV